MRLLVGLGNPGAAYERTRHNAGFKAVQAVAEALDAGWRGFKGGSLAESGSAEGKILLFKPELFMNRSGDPVRQVVDFYGITPEDICVATDDVYLAPGCARIRRGGGDGGHNGLRSLLATLPSPDFIRVRLGVGVYEQAPELRHQQPALDDYVLQNMVTHDAKQLEHTIDSLVPDLVVWLRSGEIEERTLHI